MTVDKTLGWHRQLMRSVSTPVGMPAPVLGQEIMMLAIAEVPSAGVLRAAMPIPPANVLYLKPMGERTESVAPRSSLNDLARVTGCCPIG